jgi:hypothetical protein
MSGGDSKPYAEKVPLHMVPMEFVWGAARAFAHGLKPPKNYVRDSWKNATEPDQYLGACLRHITAILDGEVFDSEGQRHIDGAAASLAIYAWHAARGFRIKQVEPKWVVDGIDRKDGASAERTER